MGRKPTARTDQSAELPTPQPAAVAAFWAMMTVVFLAAMDSTVVATVLPAIVADLDGASLLAWVVTGFLLTTAVSIPLWGKAADLTSRRWLYVTATVIFLAASVAVALAPSMPALLTARAVQGIGTGGLMALTPTILGDLFPARIRSRFQGRQGAVLASASIVGPLVGGVFAATLGWRAAFWINLPLAGLALSVVLRRLHPVGPPPKRSSRRLDLVGAGLLAAASTAFLLALSDGTPLAAEPYRTPLLVVAGVAAVVYLPWQGRHNDPVLPLRIFRSRIIAASIALSFVVGAEMLATIVYAPLYAQTAQGRSAAAAGALLLPLTGGVMLASVVGGSLITRLGRYRPFLIVGTLAVTAGFGLLATISTSTDIVPLAAALGLVGAGLGLTMQPAVLALQNAVDTADLGAATAASTFFRQLGSALAVGVIGGVLTSRAGPQLAALTNQLRIGSAAAVADRADVADVFGDLFLTLTPVAAVAVIVALLLPEKPLSTITPATSQATPRDTPLSTPSTKGLAIMPEYTTQANQPTLRINVVLDIACVWSYLRYARFLRVVERHRAAGGTIELIFRPFQVAPTAPVGGEPLSEVHKRDFGVDAAQREARMTALAAQDGVEMNFDRAVFANTFEAHRLIALSAEQGRAEAMVERLFRAYFTDGLNVADPNTLMTLAAELGVAWSHDVGSDIVRTELMRVRSSAITAVPLFIVDGGHILDGAQPEETLLSALNEAARQLKSDRAPVAARPDS